MKKNVPSKKPTTISDWLFFHSRLARTKMTPRAGWGKRPQVGMPPSQDELERRRQEAVRLEETGRSVWLSLTRQLVQVVAEVGTLGERSKVREDSQKEFLKKGQMKRPWKYWPGTVPLHRICQYQMSTELLIHKCPSQD